MDGSLVRSLGPHNRRSLCFCRGLTNSPVSSFVPGHAAGLVADRGPGSAIFS